MGYFSAVCNKQADVKWLISLAVFFFRLMYMNFINAILHKNPEKVIFLITSSEKNPMRLTPQTRDVSS